MMRSTVGIISLLLAVLPDLQARAEEGRIEWVDEKTSNILFTSKDVIRYDWDRQVFELTREAAMELSAWAPPHRNLKREFIVRDDKGIIYHAKMVSSICSQSYKGPVLSDFRFRLGDCAPPLYQMQSGYPGPIRGDSQVLMNDRLLAGLKKAGVCGKIAPEYHPKPLEVVRTDWVGDHLKIRAELFAETFRVGQPARVHLFFAKEREYDLQAEAAEIKLTLTANDGRFISETLLNNVPLAQALDEGVWACRFKPWTPAPGGENASAKAGPAKFAIEVRLFERAQDKPSPDAQPRVVWSANLPTAKVEILPAGPDTR